MENKKKGIFYGKIILFGEYGIIYDSMALTIPFTHYHGELSYSNKKDRYKYTDFDFALSSNKQISDFAGELANIQLNGKLNVNIDLEILNRDIDKGLFFESTIPQGFGLGSSGALVAAIYNRYVRNKIESSRSINKDLILKLKEDLSCLENYFHGKSSGIDPLNSYIKYPLLINSKTDIRTVAIPRNKFESDSGIFLINTGKPGKTGPLVNIFLNKCREPNYQSAILERFIPLNNSCILQLLMGEMNDFFRQLNHLSRFQFSYFPEMIPDSFRSLWKHGFESEEYILKLCGSGGGGFLLGFTLNIKDSSEYFSNKNIEFITVYKGSRT